MRYKLQCPACIKGFLLSGPQGGICMNMTCDACGAWFNVAGFEAPGVPLEYRVVGKKDGSGSYVDVFPSEPVTLVPVKEGA